MDLSHIKVGENPPHEVNVIIEIPQGGVPVKYEMDKASGAMFVDRFLHTAMFYPANYGFIPHTLSEDGDPIRVPRHAGSIELEKVRLAVERGLNEVTARAYALAGGKDPLPRVA